MKRKLMFIFCLMMLSSCKQIPETIVKEQETIVVEQPEEVGAKPQQNKIMTLSMRLPKTMNPLLNEDETVATILKLMFESMVAIDEYQKPMPNLIESYEFSQDGKSVTLILKNNLKWHDGEDVKPDDVVYSISVLQNAPETVFYKQNVKNISSCTVIDNQIEINYTQASASNAYFLDFPIIPRHFYEFNFQEKNPSEYLANKLDIVGNGAFKFSTQVNSREIMLVKNEAYFKDIPKIDNIKIIVTSDIDTDMQAFDQGVIDAISTPIVEWGKYRGNKETETDSNDTTYFDFIGLNFKNQAFKDINLRKAIAHLVPKEEIIQSIYLDYAVSTEVPINPSSWLYESSVAKYNFDLEHSKQLLIDSGYTKNEENIFTKIETIEDIQTEYILDFKILVNSENLERVNIAEIVNKNLNKIGIKSEIVSLPMDEYKELVAKKEFDIIIGGYNLSVVPDLTFLFHSSKIDTGTNIFSYKNELLDIKLEKVATATNEVILKDALSDLQLFFVEEIPCISLVFRKSALLTDKSIYGELRPTVNNIFYNINKWFIYE